MRCELVDAIRAYLQAGDLRHCTLADLADHLNIPLRTLQLRLRQWDISWSSEKRTERKRRLFLLLTRGPRLDISKAARTCGFSGPDAFLVFFQRVMDMNYTEYRLREQAGWEDECCGF